MTQPQVALIVLTWNQRDLTLDCLDSLAASSSTTARPTAQPRLSALAIPA